MLNLVVICIYFYDFTPLIILLKDNFGSQCVTGVKGERAKKTTKIFNNLVIVRCKK
jgi:hypothetical protein